MLRLALVALLLASCASRAPAPSPTTPPPAVVPDDAAPLDPMGDDDGDGTRNDKDQCPREPEDFDNFLDEDGCPDPDNDHDNVLDAADECPVQPEDFDGDKDSDGCPD